MRGDGQAVADRTKWVSAARLALSKGGIDAVRVEALARSLGVSKGSFYWHFRDRGDLHAALREDWCAGRIAAIRDQTAEGETRPRVALARLADLYARSANARGMAIELAMRDWSRRDKDTMAAVAAVDGERLGAVTRLFAAAGHPKAIAEARAFLFYTFLFGESLMAIDRGTRAARRRYRDCLALLIPPGAASEEGESPMAVNLFG